MMSMKKEIEAKLLPTTSLRKIYWEPEPLRRTWEAEESVDPVRVSCRDDEWACVDGSMCVPKNVTCSGVAECQDNSDEAVALCGCLPNEYNCGDQCIDALSRCDTVQDCDNGRDEHNCETYVCPSTHTKCANSLCIPLDAVCNLEDDCGDGSDEQECPYRTCYYLEFVCANGECVRPGRVCDGAPDCVDESDEANCTAADFAVCGNGKRVHRHWWCDGWTDCEDNHADELDCGPCNDRQYSCSDGQCISAGNVCDSQCDCVDCGDEIDCEEFYTVNSGVPECHKGVALTCVVSPLDRKKDRCIAARNICDGFNDCHNGEQVSDEYGCLNESADCALLEDQEDSLFPCSDGRCLPVHLRCDGKRDCLRGEDEDLCREAVCGRGEWRCGGGQCIPEASRCDLVLDCEDRTDEMNCEEHVCGPGKMQCAAGQCLEERFWCDHFVDCFDKSDESDCGAWTGCGHDEFLCSSGDQCIPKAQRCVLSTDPRHGCADGSHLLGCKEPSCPDDMFKCHSGPCLEKSRVCNQYIDCPDTWDDENSSTDQKCPFPCSIQAPQCQCQHLDANCSGLGLRTFPDMDKGINRFFFSDNFLNETVHKEPIQGHDNIVYLDLARNQIKYLFNGTFQNLWRLRILDLSENQLTILSDGAFTGLRNLRTLHLHGNQITTLRYYAFYGLRNLPTLDLSGQLIHSIEPQAFVGLRNLTTLSLANNVLTVVDDAAFSGLGNLKKLDLRHNALQSLSEQLFHTVPRLDHLETDEFRWCCLARAVRTCLPAADEFSSCEDLMSNLVLRVCIWILGFVALVGNTFVILWRSIYSSKNKMHSFLIVNLGLGDLLMGVYLLIVAAVDVQYRGVYSAYELVWKNSFLCQFAGFISTFSSELSVFTLTVITVDRLITIKFPFDVLEPSVVRGVMAGVWVCVGALAALPLSRLDYFGNFYGRSGVCLALHITNEKPDGWEYAVFIFLVLNSLSFTVIAVSYALMYVAARDTHSAARPSTGGGVHGADARASEGAMATRMTLIVATDAACWLPIIVLGVLSLCGIAVPRKVFAWIAVFVLPLNAAVNPVLYTLSTAPVRLRAGHAWRSVRSSTNGKSNRSRSNRTGKWCSSFRSRLNTEVTDMPPSSDQRLLSSKVPICVYTSVLPRASEPLHYTHKILDAGVENAASGRGDAIMNSSDGGVHTPLCPRDSSTPEPKEEPGSLELVPLEELTTPLQPSSARRSSRRHSRRKNHSDHRYD